MNRYGTPVHGRRSGEASAPLAVATTCSRVRFTVLCAALISTACDSSPATPTVIPGVPIGLTEEELIPFAWVGTYRGTGNGVIGGVSVTLPNSSMSISFDADGVATERCPQCVTIVVDTLFVLANVGLDDPVRLDVQYVRGATRHRLILGRFSNGSTDGTGSVLQGSLLREPVGGGPSKANISFLFERS